MAPRAGLEPALAVYQTAALPAELPRLCLASQARLLASQPHLNHRNKHTAAPDHDWEMTPVIDAPSREARQGRYACVRP